MTETSLAELSDINVPDAGLVARATDLVPLIRKFAGQGSEARRVAPEVVSALEGAGLFRMLVPKRYGGMGASLCTAVEVTKEISRGDGSTGWVTTLMMVGTGFASTFSRQAQEDVFGRNPLAKVAGTFSPGSKSERVEGGYLISGRWPYSSGSFAADWATLGVLLDGDDPMALALVPAEAWSIEPTWFVAGMKGTGSDTIVVDNHFVPEHRVQRLSNMLSSNFLTPFQNDRMANVAFNAVAAAILIAPQIGLARHALEITLAKLPGKPVAYTMYDNAKNSPTHQLAVARAATNLHISELLLNRMCLDIDTAADAGQQLDLLTRARIRNDTGIIAELIGHAIDALMTANGAGSFAEANVLNQIWRDSEIAARHAFVTPEIGKEAYGRVLMGLEPTINL
jgi:alkylation response protein AidB-like acyl-CoA dehydrogenase